MKHFIYNCIFIIIVIFFAYINTLYDQEEKQKIKLEGFTPIFRQMYRPYVRNARIISEGFYEKNKSDISNLFRKFGIM
jgi:hypothetical protein